MSINLKIAVILSIFMRQIIHLKFLDTIALMAFNGSEKEQAYVVVLLIPCAYDTTASTVNIILIYHMKMTGNLSL